MFQRELVLSNVIILVFLQVLFKVYVDLYNFRIFIFINLLFLKLIMNYDLDKGEIRMIYKYYK